MSNAPTSTTANGPDRAAARTGRRRALRLDKVIDTARIEKALETVALLLEENERYLPIFLRLETELEAARRSADALARAKAIARKAR
ncbi:hypothetical protein AN189_17145 [Loktanella sp. 3ANDIMAR09]|uniref:hypothetical protein n=1 Tax=Loktanella sp. 3ANDIMAR09 TaxID=1225657 RepID=UPI000700DCDC|nr:hypothetical protein [Loktanella sp. 3ANDIMAR09]KQI67080.1 hypothetical protein AN189_17145 [Loktanella sp. 3ANDIMAR09]